MQKRVRFMHPTGQETITKPEAKIPGIGASNGGAMGTAHIRVCFKIQAGDTTSIVGNLITDLKFIAVKWWIIVRNVPCCFYGLCPISRVVCRKTSTKTKACVMISDVVIAVENDKGENYMEYYEINCESCSKEAENMLKMEKEMLQYIRKIERIEKELGRSIDVGTGTDLSRWERSRSGKKWHKGRNENHQSYR